MGLATVHPPVRRMALGMHTCNGPRAGEAVITWGSAQTALGPEFDHLYRFGRLVPTNTASGLPGFVADPDGFPVVYTRTRTERWRTALSSRNADELLQAARDHDCFVRSELTRNENAPDSVLEKLLGDPHPGVADRAEWVIRDRIENPAHAVTTPRA